MFSSTRRVHFKSNIFMKLSTHCFFFVFCVLTYVFMYICFLCTRVRSSLFASLYIFAVVYYVLCIYMCMFILYIFVMIFLYYICCIFVFTYFGYYCLLTIYKLYVYLFVYICLSTSIAPVCLFIFIFSLIHSKPLFCTCSYQIT